jgi:hypothetical protein
VSEPRVHGLPSFLLLFEQRGYSYGEWRSVPGEFAYFVANEDVSRFVQLLYEEEWVEPFNWSEWQPPTDALYRDPEALSRARLST